MVSDASSQLRALYESQEPKEQLLAHRFTTPQIYNTFHRLTQKATLGSIRALFSVSLISSMARATQQGAQEHPASWGELLLYPDNCGASLLLLLLLGFFQSISTHHPPSQSLSFSAQPPSPLQPQSRGQNFCHHIRAGNSFKSSREKSPFIDTSNQGEGNRPTAL